MFLRGYILSYELKSFSSFFGSLDLTGLVRLFFAVQLRVIQPLLTLQPLHSQSLSTSHITFQSSFSSLLILFRSCRFTVLFFFLTSAIRLFLYDIHSNACSEVLFWSLCSFSKKRLYLFPKKKKAVILLQVWFRNRNGRFSTKIIQISFCCRVFTRAKFPHASQNRTVVEAHEYINSMRDWIRLAFPVIGE